jgi:acyl-CoA synthetase (AMP-forming)/AMP-acid ligase II
MKTDAEPRGDLEFGTIPRLLAQSAGRFGELVAIEESELSLSYGELEGRVRAAAKAMIALGVSPGDRVAIWAPNVWEWIATALAIHSVGGVLVPINTRYKGTEAAYLLNKSGAKLLFTLQGFLGIDYVALLRASGEATQALADIVVFRGASGAGTTGYDAFLSNGAAVSDAIAGERALAVQGDDVADILFTSGTTGSPKGAMCTHAQNLRTFRSWCHVTGLRRGDRYLIAMPFFHTFGYKAGWLSALMMGATVLPEAAFDVQRVLERISRDKVSVFPGPPAIYRSLLAHPDLGRHDLSSLRLAVTGADVIQVDLIHRMRSELHFDTVITGYGLTESTGVVTMCRYDDDPETIATTSGRAIADVEVVIADRDGKRLPPNESGEILVRGYNVMKGYFEDSEGTAQAIDGEGFLHTGDVGILDERGYLRITDRIKDMYIVGGFNAYPVEIERMLLNHPKIAEAAVVGIPDARLGEVGMAFVVEKPGSDLSEDEVIAWSRENMANFKVPRRVEKVASFPRNAMGKVLKFELRKRAVEGESRR